MEKLPTILLPRGSDGDATATSPRAGSCSPSRWELPKVPTKSSLLRLGGIRVRCPQPQQLVEDFYVKRLGMQEVALTSSPVTRPGVSTDSLEFRLILLQKQQLHQLMQATPLRQQQKRSGASSSRSELGSVPGEGPGGFKNNLTECEGLLSKGGSRRTSFCSLSSSRNDGIGVFQGTSRFVAFELFSTAEIEAAATETPEVGETQSPTQKNWLTSGFGQFVLECVPVQKFQGLYRPYEHHQSDVFSRLAFCVPDVDAAALYLSQHMIRVEPAGQFLDMAYGASFLDPHNFRGRLLQYMSEYEMVSRKALHTSESKTFHCGTSESFTGKKEQIPDLERSESPVTTSEGKDMQRCASPLSREFSSTSSNAISVLHAEREGCLPVPTLDERKAVGSEESCTPDLTVRFEKLLSEKPPVLHHIELLAADAERTLSFYEEVLGMTLIEKKTAQGFGFTLYYLAFDPPKLTSYRYWLWLQTFSCICIKASTDSSQVSPYQDLEPAECGFLGFSLLCPRKDEERLMKRFLSKSTSVEYVEDEVYGRKVMLLRDPQNVPIRIVLTS